MYLQDTYAVLAYKVWKLQKIHPHKQKVAARLTRKRSSTMLSGIQERLDKRWMLETAVLMLK
jgi:hypothetical protein